MGEEVDDILVPRQQVRLEVGLEDTHKRSSHSGTF
jgi:hypothetical protein